MRKAFNPSIFVPGAIRATHKEGGISVPSTDAKGRPLWKMPKPIRFVENYQIVSSTKVIKGVHKSVKKKEKVPFRVYRALPASLARYYRAQQRRMHRKSFTDKLLNKIR